MSGSHTLNRVHHLRRTACRAASISGAIVAPMLPAPDEVPPPGGVHAPVLRALAPWIERHRRTAWRPVLAAEGDADASRRLSRFGGAPSLRAGESLPACGKCSKPLDLFLQLDGRETPAESPWTGPLVLQLLRNGASDGRREGATASLTPRQRQVLRLLADGVQAKVIASRLGITEVTVRNHIAAILKELRCHSQLEAVVEAQRRGLL